MSEPALKRDLLEVFDLKPKPITTRFALMFGLRYMLDQYGYDPCDEWCVEEVLGLPDGLRYRPGQIQFECRCCGEWSEWPADAADFDIDNPTNLCGGSPRCCP